MLTDSMLSQLIFSIKKRKQLHFLFKSLTAYIIILAILMRLASDGDLQLVILSIVIFSLLQIAFWLLQATVTENRLLRYLDNRFPELENSSELLISCPDSALSKLQLKRIQDQLKNLDEENKLSAALPALPVQSLLAYLSVAVFFAILITFIPTQQNKINEQNIAPVTIETDIDHVQYSLTNIIETPDQYTNKEPIIHQKLTAEITQGSMIEWQLKFLQPVNSVNLEFINSPVIKLKKNNNNIWSGKTKLKKSMLYHININASQNYDKYKKYRLQMIKDNAPVIKIIEPYASITELPVDAAENVFTRNIKASFNDDYSVESAQMIITLAKGTGENVRFRDQKINLFNDGTLTKISNKKLSINYQLDLKKLGMETGDELYFRIEATDNQLPQANIGRSGSYIIRWPDPEMMASEEMGSMMMRQMPDFFRSQRQIIIDTEKLIAEKNNISENTFENRSQDIAESQKVLRLRYGQFLGEEYESGISSNLKGMITSLAEQAMLEEQHDSDTTHSKELSTNDDHQHNAAADKALKINTIMDVMTTFGHLHDKSEQSTLLDEKTTKLLKVALTSMWEAELRLRLIQPSDALPSEYKALEFIKKAQQAERIYLQRVGFEPPPLKEERRLSAELDEIQQPVESRLDKLNQQQQLFQNIIMSLTYSNYEVINNEQLLKLKKHLSNALDDNSYYQDAMADLKILLQQPNCLECKKSLSVALWNLLNESRDKVAVPASWQDPISNSFEQQKQNAEKQLLNDELKQ